MQSALNLDRTGFFGFHPAIRAWFEETHGKPTPVQAAAWPVIGNGESALISAPTGTGKTLAAWLPLIDALLRDPPESSGVRVLYVSPLRALGRDMVAGLSSPLEALRAMPGSEPLVVPELGLRTGDTPSAERRVQSRHPPAMLATTPESLYVLLASAAGRRMLRSCRQVIVDEIHAIAGDKRGADLSLGLERLEALAGGGLQRIGVSATQRPVDRMAAFLAGTGRECQVVRPMADRVPDVRIELPETPLGAFPGQAHWRQIHARLADLAQGVRSMLVFCNTRAQVERTAAALSRDMGDEHVAAHHASLGQQRRFEVEQGLKHGHLKVVVTSASLELGIDIGAVDLVCQLGSPSRINPFRQRAGRACHRPGGTPAARLFPLTLADLLESRGLTEALERGELDETFIPEGPADVLCQHLVAMVAAGETRPGVLHDRVRRAWPWRNLTRDALDELIRMIGDGYVPGRDGHRALIRVSVDGKRLSAGDEAARIVLQNGGTIPEWFAYEVIRASDNELLGSLDEEFSFESSPGQIIQLGNRTLRILSILPDRVLVEEADGETPNVPFWFGDGPGRSLALSHAVAGILDRHDKGSPAAAEDEQLTGFLEQSRQVLGVLPGRDTIVLERFFDPGGDQHLVIHAPVGARINRAWGLALRKRFCRSFNFELQAAALDNGVLISLGATHSFGLMDVIGFLRAASVREVLIQALLDTPVYLTRFRWCANNALAIRRRHNGRRVAAPLQRNQAENLIARVFPDQLACLENIQGDRQVPDHPLVRQALTDCLEDYLDIQGLEALLGRMEGGDVKVHGVESTAPSLLAEALIHAPRHAFLDPAAAEERRTRSFEVRARGEAGAITPPAQVRAPRSGWIQARSQAGFERALTDAGYITSREGETGVSVTGLRSSAGGWVQPFRLLVRERAAVSFSPHPGSCLWVAVDRLPQVLALWPDGAIRPRLPAASLPAPLDDPDEALSQLLLARVRALEEVTPAQLASETGLSANRIAAALAALQGEGVIMAGRSGGWVHREAADGRL